MRLLPPPCLVNTIAAPTAEEEEEDTCINDTIVTPESPRETLRESRAATEGGLEVVRGDEADDLDRLDRVGEPLLEPVVRVLGDVLLLLPDLHPLRRQLAPDLEAVAVRLRLVREDEMELENRVTDTSIPEQVIRTVEGQLVEVWRNAKSSRPPHEYFYQILPENESSWLCAAKEMGIPVFTPGWADSTMGNIFSARLIDGTLQDSLVITNDLDRMIQLADWYRSQNTPLGFLQVGGGIAGDFAVCVVPMLRQDLLEDVPRWSWFAQISESRPSYGGYSGAPPNEKISWQKLGPETPRFVIESDASIVLPLLLQYLLDGQ